MLYCIWTEKEAIKNTNSCEPEFILIADHNPSRMHDPVLNEIMQYIQWGWPTQLSASTALIYDRKLNEITIEGKFLIGDTK